MNINSGSLNVGSLETITYPDENLSPVEQLRFSLEKRAQGNPNLTNKVRNFFTAVHTISTAHVHDLNSSKFPFINQPDVIGGGPNKDAMCNIYNKHRVHIPKDKNDKELAEIKLSPFYWCVENGLIQQVRDRVYDPVNNRQSVVQVDLDNGEQIPALNTCLWPPEPKMYPEPAEFLRWFNRYIPDQDERTYVLDVISELWHRPYHTMGWLAFICPLGGSGKGIMKRVIEAIIGASNCKTVTEDHILGNNSQSQYNDFVAKIVCFVTEMGTASSVYGGYQKMMAVIKMMFDRGKNRIQINKKGRDNIDTEAYATGFFFSNNTFAVPIEKNDRRGAFIECRAIKNDPRLKEFLDWFQDETGRPKVSSVQALRYFFSARRQSENFDPFADAPHFRLRAQAILQTESDLDKAIALAIETITEQEDAMPIMNEPDFQRLVLWQYQGSMVVALSPGKRDELIKRLPAAMRFMKVERPSNDEFPDKRGTKGAYRHWVKKDGGRKNVYIVVFRDHIHSGELAALSVENVKEVCDENAKLVAEIIPKEKF